MARRSTGGHGLVVPVSVGVVGLALIGIGQTVPNRHAIQDDLTSRSTEALAAADLVGLSVSFSGRDASITGSGTGDTAARAEAVVESVDGVRVAKAKIAVPATTPTPAADASAAPTEAPTETAAPTETSAPAETPAAPAKPAALPVGFTLVDGTITVTGTVGSKSAGKDLIAAVTAVGKGWKVVDRLTIDGALAAPAPKASKLSAVTRLLAQAPIDGPKLVIQYNRGSVILRGTPPDAATERALLGAAAATVKGRSAVVDGLDTP